MFDIFKKLFKFSGSRKRILAWSVIAGVLKSAVDLLQILAIFLSVTALVEGVSVDITVKVVVVMLAYLTGKFVFVSQSDYWRGMSGLLMCTDKRMELGNKLKYVPMGYFNENSVGKITSAVTTDMYLVEMMGPFGADKVVNGLFHALLLSVATLVFDWRLGLIVLATVALYEAAFALMQRAGKKNFPEIVNVNGRLAVKYLEYISGIGVVRSFNAQSEAVKNLNAVINESRSSHFKTEMSFVPSSLLMKFVLRAGSIALMLCSALFYLEGTLELASAITLIAVSFIMFANLEESAVISPIIRGVDASLDKLNEVFDMPRMDIDGKKIELENTDIAIENVEFSYGKNKVIDGVTLDIHEKSAAAFVGPSGGGKTTLCRLIARFWDIDKGNVKIGGVNVKEFDFDSLMKNISMVFQNVYLFADTVANNIRFGKPDASDEEVFEAAKKARCHDFITKLEKGYDTVIGEGGCTLSGGEKQRISVARAMMKDAPIIILDEATASIDPENESEMLDAIKELSKDKTVITIAHKLATVKNADMIAVIDKGKIEELGKHDELVKNKKLYNKFIEIRQTAEGWKL